MNKQDIQLVLDAWQKEMQAVGEQMEKLYRLFGYNEGGFSGSIGFLQEGYTRLLADHIDFDFDILIDWWLAHDFGKRPLEIGFKGEELTSIKNNKELAEWIVEFKREE